MKVENLEEGMVVKNYKKMCAILGEKEKGGKSKNIQLESWRRFFEYEKKGHKFSIVKIKPSKPKNLTKNEKSSILELFMLEKLIEMGSAESNIIDEYKFNTLGRMGVLKTSYVNKRYGMEENITSTDCIKIIKDIQDLEERSIVSKFESALKRLENRGSIKFGKNPRAFALVLSDSSVYCDGSGMVNDFDMEAFIIRKYMANTSLLLAELGITNKKLHSSANKVISLREFYKKVIDYVNIDIALAFGDVDFLLKSVTTRYTIFTNELNILKEHRSVLYEEVFNICGGGAESVFFENHYKDRITASIQRSKNAEKEAVFYDSNDNYMKNFRVGAEYIETTKEVLKLMYNKI